MNKKKLPSTQSYLEISQIREGIMILKDGSLRMVLMATSLNFALKSEEEQKAIIFAYQNFLNSLTFPLQILIQSRQIDLDHYLNKLKSHLEEETNELVRLQTADYISFVQKLISLANIMDKKFFLVVPFAPLNVKKRSLFDKIFHPKKMVTPTISEQEFHSYKEELLQRVNVVSTGLASLGVRTALLNTQQLVELFYNTYNPEEASKEKLTKIEMLEEPIVKKEASPNQGSEEQGG